MKKSDLTKNRIVSVAERLFLTQAVDKVSISKIAQAAGVAKGTVYLYFETKEDLVWAVTEKYLNEFMVILNGLGSLQPTFESVDTIIDALFDFIHENEDKMKMLHHVSFYGYLGKNRMEKKYEDPLKVPLMLWVQEGVKLGVFSVENIPFTVDYIQTSVHHMIDAYILEESPYEHTTIQNSLKAMIRKLLR